MSLIYREINEIIKKKKSQTTYHTLIKFICLPEINMKQKINF